jgi:hypothetical protein
VGGEPLFVYARSLPEIVPPGAFVLSRNLLYTFTIVDQNLPESGKLSGR